LEFHRPKSLEEAVELLKQPSSVVVAGGTAFSGKPQAEQLVDLTALNLSYVSEKEDGFHVGAATTISELEKSTVAKMAGGFLHQACSLLADTPLRNMITVGGNIACRHVWAHLPPVLMALDSKVLISGKKERKANIEDVVSNGLGQGEFIREVIIPKKSGRGVFKKFALTRTDYAAVIVAVYSDESELRIAVGGLAQPLRLKELEKSGNGGRVNPEQIGKAVDRITPAFHPLLSADHRKEVLKVLLKRALQEVGKI